jgi:hypothetical protein
VRRVLEAELKNGVLRLAVQRMGQVRPSKLEICRDRDRRTPSAKKAARSLYQQRLQRVLERMYPGFALTRLSNAMDLEHSFGPIYVRGLLRKGRSAFAVFGVNHQETQASIDAALTFAILWLDTCRHSQDGKVLIEGLKLVNLVRRIGEVRHPEAPAIIRCFACIPSAGWSRWLSKTWPPLMNGWIPRGVFPSPCLPGLRSRHD